MNCGKYTTGGRYVNNTLLVFLVTVNQKVNKKKI